MLALVLLGLIGGLITGVSPCILPMLPIIFFAGAAGTGGAQQVAPVREPVTVGGGSGPAPEVLEAGGEADRPARTRFFGARPLQIIAGLIVSFTVFTLLGSVILSSLGLPDSLLRWIGVAILAVVGVSLMFPAVEEWIQKPFYRLPKVQGKLHGNPFVFGLGLGTLYVPCAGPVLAAVTVAGATGKVGIGTVALTVSFAIGAAAPLLVFAAAGDRIRDRLTAYRSRARLLSVIGGVVMVALAAALAFGATDALQRAVPNYTQGLQDKVENSDKAQGALSGLTNAGNTELSKCTPGAGQLQSCGTAPKIDGITSWLNTPGGAPVDIAGLKGKVVLVDFWAYSCINCQRSVPHVEAWDEAYRDAGLQVIGVHAPEFAFEKSTRNLTSAVKSMGIEYPVAQDNSLATWTNYRNRYWPAEYLIDATGTVRHIKFGEGDYDQTESLIRQLLTAANPSVKLPAATGLPDTAPTAGSDLTPETYFGYTRSSTYAGTTKLLPGKTGRFSLPDSQPADSYSLGGSWKVAGQYLTATEGSTLRLSYRAKDVYLVLAGEGTLQVSTPGQPTRTVQVHGVPTLHPVLQLGSKGSGVLTVTASAGVQFYTATFG